MLVDMEDQVYMSYLCVLFITYCLSKSLLGGGDDGVEMQFARLTQASLYAQDEAVWEVFAKSTLTPLYA